MDKLRSNAGRSNSLQPTELQRLLETISDKLSHDLAGVIREQLQGFKAQHGRQPLLSVKEVADFLNVSTRTVETLISEGVLVPLRIRGSRRFTPETLESFLVTCNDQTREAGA